MAGRTRFRRRWYCTRQPCSFCFPTHSARCAHAAFGRTTRSMLLRGISNPAPGLKPKWSLGASRPFRLRFDRTDFLRDLFSPGYVRLSQRVFRARCGRSLQGHRPHVARVLTYRECPQRPLQHGPDRYTTWWLNMCRPSTFQVYGRLWGTILN